MVRAQSLILELQGANEDYWGNSDIESNHESRSHSDSSKSWKLIDLNELVNSQYDLNANLKRYLDDKERQSKFTSTMILDSNHSNKYSLSKRELAEPENIEDERKVKMGKTYSFSLFMISS